MTVLELCTHGTLEEYIFGDENIGWQQKAALCQSIAAGMSYGHSR
jgi:hypothetical protein